MALVLNIGVIANGLILIALKVNGPDGGQVRLGYGSDGYRSTVLQPQHVKQLKPQLLFLFLKGGQGCAGLFQTVLPLLYLCLCGGSRLAFPDKGLVRSFQGIYAFFCGLNIAGHLIVGIHQGLGRVGIGVRRFLNASGALFICQVLYLVIDTFGRRF